MFYYLFDFLDKHFNFPGAGVFQYISFRAGAAAVLSLLITITFGKRLIEFLRRKQVGEAIRDLGEIRVAPGSAGGTGHGSGTRATVA